MKINGGQHSRSELVAVMNSRLGGKLRTSVTLAFFQCKIEPAFVTIIRLSTSLADTHLTTQAS